MFDMRALWFVYLAWAAAACTGHVAPPTAAPHRALTAAPAPQPADTLAPPAQSALPAQSTEPGVAVGTHGAVASAERHASQVGLAVLQRGGNAVDAAIAVAFALAVTHPVAGNLGGGGFMLVRTADGRSTALDYRETAPAAATSDMYLDAAGQPTAQSVIGPRAAGIPGTVAGMELAHARFGTLPWSELLAPATALARDGHALDDSHAADMADAAQRMRNAGFGDTARIYSRADGTPHRSGETWKQPELARTLEYIASRGARAFYEGNFAGTLAASVKAVGGIWARDDLAHYAAVQREPIRFTHLGHEIITMPPPSGGGIVLRQLLYASETLKLSELPWRSVQAEHLYLEAARRAFADRSIWIADPAYADVPTAELMDPGYIASRMRDIDPARATASSAVRAGDPKAAREPLQTTHFSVVDSAGNAVSNTYTLNGAFGALVAIPGTGILLNNEMDDFASRPGRPNLYGLVQGERNAIAPGKRMLSSMTPTIIVRDGALRAVLGSPGGPTITTTVAQLVMALVDYGRTLPEAVLAARLHHQWLPDQVTVEPSVEPALVDGLKALGHKVVPAPFGRLGHANCIEVDPSTGGYRAVADVSRGGGAALAY